MRLTDLLRLALSALYQQKLRTLLTTLGVAFGCSVLVFSLAMGNGVQETIVREYSRYAGLRQIDVNLSYEQPRAEDAAATIPVQGTMSEEKRQRLRREILRHRQGKGEQTVKVRLTPDQLQRLAAIPHVRSVVPTVDIAGRVVLNGRAEEAVAHSASPDHEHLRQRVVAGEFLSAPDGDSAVVTEYLLYRLGIADDAAVQGVLGRRLRLEYRTNPYKPHLLLALFNANRARVNTSEQELLDKVLRQLPAALERLDLTPAEKEFLRKTLQPPTAAPRREDATVTREFTIVGVLRGAAPGDRREFRDWWVDAVDVVLPAQTAADLFFEVPADRKAGLWNVLVEADSPDHVKEVAGAIGALGFRTQSLVELIEREQFMYLMLFGLMTCVAVVALVIAALGIINTMLISVLERTREIGIMRAVGARPGHIQAVFLVEGMLIGLVGGLLGLAAGWAVALPSDAWVRSLAAARLNIHLEESVFAWPVWLLLGSPLFACLVTTLAAVYPARRAARVNPITALRHE